MWKRVFYKCSPTGSFRTPRRALSLPRDRRPVAGFLNNMHDRIRVLIAKPGLDGHDRGAKVIARALRDAGMEVIYTGLRQTPEMIVNAALQEDVQVIGLSILSGAHNAIVPRVLELLREREMADVLVIAGGIIPDDDAAQLKNEGVAAVYQPGASLDEIVNFIRSSVKQAA
ncbi:MAG TPA: cobalamin B12-binding domain-containing protein [Bryobacteraceae bacterium]|nr:cobalamin B12-binding domain-containing protein [Bryobacteraceae bacterium]